MVKMLKWVLIAVALVAVIALTVPSTGFYACEHEYVKNENCTQGVCVKCDEVIHYSGPNHAYTTVGCDHRSCEDCGKTEEGDFHSYYKVSCTDKMVCDICGSEKRNPAGVHHANTVIRREQCTDIVSCADCGKWIADISAHEWVTENCEEGFVCKNCGSDIYPYSHTHSYAYSGIRLLYSVGVCKKCSHVTFGWLGFGVIFVFVGLLMSVGAVVFLFRNRKRICVQGGKFIRIATPGAHLPEDEVSKHMF